MSTGRFKELVQRYIEEVWNQGMPAAPFFAAHYKRYVTATAVPLTGSEQAERIKRFRNAFPDIHFTIDDLIADGNRVVFRAMMRGTHRAVFGTLAPTGKHIAVAVLDVIRIEDGLFVEHWGGPDLFDLFQQLGASGPATASAQAIE